LYFFLSTLKSQHFWCGNLIFPAFFHGDFLGTVAPLRIAGGEGRHGGHYGAGGVRPGQGRGVQRGDGALADPGGPGGVVTG